MAKVGDVLNGAVLEDALPGLAAGLDGELDALVLAEAGRGRGGSGGGSGVRHCDGLVGSVVRRVSEVGGWLVVTRRCVV